MGTYDFKTAFQKLIISIAINQWLAYQQIYTRILKNSLKKFQKIFNLIE